MNGTLSASLTRPRGEGTRRRRRRRATALGAGRISPTTAVLASAYCCAYVSPARPPLPLGQRQGRMIRHTPSSQPITVNHHRGALQVLDDATLITTLPIFWPVST